MHIFRIYYISYYNNLTRLCIWFLMTAHQYINYESGALLTKLKDAMPVSFRSELFTSYFLTIFKQ